MNHGGRPYATSNESLLFSSCCCCCYCGLRCYSFCYYCIITIIIFIILLLLRAYAVRVWIYQDSSNIITTSHRSLLATGEIYTSLLIMLYLKQNNKWTCKHIPFNPLRTKMYPPNLKTHFVPSSKHILLRLYKRIS